MLADVELYTIRNIQEPNGNLAFLGLPFTVNRVFYVYGVREGDIRGHHAHKECKQLLICLNGAVNVTCDDGCNRKVYTLDSPLKGLYIPPGIWAEQFYHSKDTMLVGLASQHYDESDYIRDYDTYKGVM